MLVKLSNRLKLMIVLSSTWNLSKFTREFGESQFLAKQKAKNDYSAPRFVNLAMKELSRTHEWPVRLSLIVILSRYDVLGTIDVNLNELQYLAARLNPFECRRLIAALHYTTYELPSNLADAGKPISDCNDDSICPFDRKKRNIDRKISWKLNLEWLDSWSLIDFNFN